MNISRIKIIKYLTETKIEKESLKKYSVFQEVDGTRTSNGIQYRLQLLYSNGK